MNDYDKYIQNYQVDDRGVFYVDKPYRRGYRGGSVKEALKEGDVTIGPKSFVSNWHLAESKSKPINKPNKYSSARKQEILQYAIDNEIITVSKLAVIFNVPYGTIKNWKFDGCSLRKMISMRGV